MLKKLKNIIIRHPKKLSATGIAAGLLADYFGVESGAAQTLVEAGRILVQLLAG